MTDQPTTTVTTQTDQPAMTNGFSRLTATTAPAPPAPATMPAPAPPPPTTEPAAAPPPSTTARPPAAPSTTPVAAEEPTPYRDQPHLLPEHALLGSLLHAPAALDKLEQFLGTRDFATQDTRAIYATLRGLHRTGALYDVTALPTEAQRLHAANENHLRLFTALRATPPPFTGITVKNIPGIIAQLNAAAPLQTLPYRGVYDPTAQLHLGRMVLEDSCRRQLRAMGVTMRNTAPLIPPTTTALHGPQRTAHTLASNLEQIHHQLQHLTERLIRAIHQTPPTTPTEDQTRTTTTTTRPRRIPHQLRVLSAPLQYRAERHILHLALHAGRLDTIPHEILNLSPNDFSHLKHANLWHTIKNLQARGLPVNYVAVFRETRNPQFPHHPMPGDRTLTRFAQPPNIKPDRVARSLHTLVSAALNRATRNTNTTITTLATNKTTPIDTLLNHATNEISTLANRTTTAIQQYQAINHTNTAHRR